MTAALAIDSSLLVRELYDVLSGLDSATWRAEFEANSRERLAKIRSELEQLIANASTESEPLRARRPTLSVRLHELTDSIEGHLPTLEDTEASARARWMAFREAMTPHYESVVDSLKVHQVYAPSLLSTNYTRNGMDMIGAACTVLIIQFVPQVSWLPIVAACMAVSAWSVELLRRFSPRANEAVMWIFQKVSHPHERYRVNSATWYVTALLLISLTGDAMAMTMGVVALGVGDPMAAIIGRRFGRIRNLAGRSLEGSLAFVLSTSIVAIGCLGAFDPSLSSGSAIVMALACGSAGAVTELFSRSLDDNLTIPIATTAVALMVSALL